MFPESPALSVAENQDVDLFYVNEPPMNSYGSNLPQTAEGRSQVYFYHKPKTVFFVFLFFFIFVFNVGTTVCL